MRLSPTSVALVRRTWADVETIAPEAARLFYANLFAADPCLRALFQGDTETLSHRLITSVAVAVATLDRPEVLRPVLTALGRRHGACGVRSADYILAGGAFLAMLSEALGDAFTPAVEDAWADVYGAIANVMISAAEAAPAFAVA